MKSQENELFRQEALERLSSPEQLDQTMQVVKRRAWLPLATFGSLIVVAVIWSIFGRIPVTLNGEGVIIRPGKVVSLQVPSEGQILTLNFKPGDTIKQEQVLGTIDQPQLEQQLKQEELKLADLLNQNNETDELERQKIGLERQNLRRQRTDLQANLRSYEESGPTIRKKGLESIAQRRENLKQSLQQTKNNIPTLEKRHEARKDLEQRGVVDQDTVLLAKQELTDNLIKVSDLEAQLKGLDLQVSEQHAAYLKDLNSIKEIKTQIQKIDVQLAQLTEQDRKQSFDKKNQVQTTELQIKRLESELYRKSKIISPYNGRVLEVSVSPGRTVTAHNSIARIEKQDGNAQPQVAIYLTDKDGKQIEPGMLVQVTPSTVKRERFGGIVGKVTEIPPYPVTTQEITETLGNEDQANNILQRMSPSGGALMQGFASLEQDPKTKSGYKWSSSNGPPLEITSGTTAQVRVQVGEKAPISYVIPIFKSLTGLY